MQRTHAHSAWLLALALLGTACDRARLPGAEHTPPPEVRLALRDAQHVELTVAGAEGLRGVQATFVYDPAAVQIVAVHAGADAARIDRVLAADPKQAQGRLVVGLTDTRRVLLPARGALIDLELVAPATTRTTVRLEQILAVREGGEALRLPDAALELAAQEGRP